MAAKGPLHTRLQQLLHDAWKAKVFKQDSLAKAIGYSQENAGQYLRGGKAGALDLDQAAAALDHIGSSLSDFVAGIPPRELSATERLARELEARPELAALVEDLLPVPRTKLSDVIELTRGIGRVASPRRGGRKSGSTSGSRAARRTTKARATRR